MTIKVHIELKALWHASILFPRAEAGLLMPKRDQIALNDPLYIFPFNQVVFHIKPFFHPGSWPPLPKRRNWIAHIRARHEAVTTKIIVILLLPSSLCFVGQLMHIAETFRTRLQSLASHGPNKTPILMIASGVI